MRLDNLVDFCYLTNCWWSSCWSRSQRVHNSLLFTNWKWPVSLNQIFFFLLHVFIYFSSLVFFFFNPTINYKSFSLANKISTLKVIAFTFDYQREQWPFFFQKYMNKWVRWNSISTENSLQTEKWPQGFTYSTFVCIFLWSS